MEPILKKKIWLSSIPLLLIGLVYGILVFVILPIVTDYANGELLELSKKNQHVALQFEKIDFEIFDPRLIIKNIRIKTKEKLNVALKDFEIGEVDLKIDWFQLILGKLNFNMMSIEELRLEIDLDNLLAGPKEKSEFKIGQLYNVLNMVPIQRFKIDNLNLVVISKKRGVTFRINESFLRTSYLDSKFLVRLGIKNSVFKNDKNGSVFPLEANLNSLLTKNSLVLRELALKVRNNSFKIEGVVDDVDQLNDSASGRIAIESQNNLQEIKTVLEQFNVLSLKEKIEGKVTVGGALTFNGLHSIDGNIDFKSENIIFDKFNFGTAIIKSEFKKDKVKFSNIDLIHPAGKVKLSDSTISLKEPHEFKTSVSSERFDLQKLFLSLNLKEVPVYIDISPRAQCEGSIGNFNAFCKVETKGSGLKVLSHMGDLKSRIVELPEFAAAGEFFADMDKIAFKGIATLNENTAESEGLIEFKKGFDIKFKAAKLDLKNIVSLANLDFKGVLALEGSTQGNSRKAVFGMKVSSTDFSLEKYNFGILETQMRYEAGTLYLADMKGTIDQSKYVGNLDVNLKDNQISGAIDFESSKLKDILFITKDIVPIPFLIDGFGSVKVKLNGPLDFWKMDYKLDADFKDVQIHTELFSNLKMSINAEKGTARFTDSHLTKKNSNLSIEGSINSDKTFSLTGQGNGFKLEESEFVKALNVSIFGDYNFDFTTKGPINNPKLSVQIKLSETLVGEKQLEPSDLKLNLDRAAMEWDMKLFDSKLNAMIRWPFDLLDTKYVFNSQFNNFDFTIFFPFIGAESIQDDYLGNLSGQTILTATERGLKDLDGKILIDDLKLQRGALKLNLAEKGTIDCKHGEFTISEMKLTGADNIVELSGDNFTFDRLNVRLSAKSDLRILHFLAPFLEEVSGPFEMGARVSGSILAPKILGQALLTDAYIKIKNFVHPFEKINTTLVFSQSKIFVQNLKTNFAGGTLKSDGQIEILGPKNVPLFLNIKAENVSLNVPDKIRTVGNGNLVLSGKWFPFMLAGTYNVNGGLFEKEIGGDETAQTFKQSIYLPKVLKEKTFDPLAFDINVFLENKYLIKNSQAEGYVNGNIQFKGPLSNILVFGKLEIEKATKLYFKDKTFELQSGLVNFTSTTEINPELYIAATSRVNEYDINLLIQGPSKTASTKMTSSPPLAENEIISLLALGVTSSQLEQNVQSKDQATQTGYEIGAAVLSQSALTKNLKNKLGLDIQFVNQFDSTRNIGVLKATASKKLSNKIQATASRSLTEAGTDVKVQYFFNKNVSAVGNWEGREVESVQSSERQSQSVFGLDLEFKREFR